MAGIVARHAMPLSGNQPVAQGDLRRIAVVPSADMRAGRRGRSIERELK